MAISSINIQPSKGNAIIHNERIFDVAYALKDDSVNEYHRIASITQTRKAIYDDYQTHHGRKLNTKATPIREGLINLNHDHTMEDLKKLAELLEKEFGIKPLHLSIHRDEGHIDQESKEEKINYHAHMVFSNYNFETHTSIKLNENDMKKMQTITAQCLGMERGKENSKKQRLDHRQYKRAMQEVDTATKELKSELTKVKAENKTLKEEVYNFKDMQKTITSLENLNSEQKKELHSLNSQVKNNKADNEQLQERIKELASTVENKDLKIQELRATNMQLTTNTIGQDQQVKALKKENEDLQELAYYTKEDGTKKPYKDIAIEYRDAYKELKERVEKLEQQKAAADRQAAMYLGISEEKNIEVQQLSKELTTLKTHINSLQAQNESLGVKVHELEEKSVPKQNMNDYEPIKTKEEFLKSPQIIEIQEKIDKLQGKLAVIKDYTQEDYKADLKELKEKYKIPDSVKPSDIAKEYKERTTITKENLRDLNAYAKEQNKSKSQKVLEID